MRNQLTGGFALILVGLLADISLGVCNLLVPAGPERVAVVYGLIALLAAALLGVGLFLLRSRPAPVVDRADAVPALPSADTGDARRPERDQPAGYQATNLLESIGEAFLAVDRDWRFTYLNRQAESLLERRREDLLGKPLWVEYPDALGTAFSRNYRRSLVENTPICFEEYYAPHDRWYEVHTYPSAAGLTVYFRDGTERHRAQAELRRRADDLAEADRRKDEFLAMLGHELRNPLAPVRNAVAILGMPHVGPAHLEQARAMIERQVQQMTRLVDDLLDVSRITRNKINLQRDRLDLAALVRAVVEDQRPVVARAGLALALEAPREPAWVEGDAVRLTQVVDNLLHNAMKFTDTGGRIDVRVAADAGARRVTVTIRDTGIGIEPAMLPRLFDSFAQSDRSVERSRGGLGLGLALVRGLVGLHGGGVRADSEGVGRGSMFTFFLPLTDAPQVVETPAKSATNGARRRVLLIEDNRDAADSLRLLLQLSGHEVAVAYTGTDGVETAGRLRPDVVLCDIGLPGLSGYDIARALRQREATAAALLVALSGYGGDEDQRRSRDAGFHFHLVKPVNPEEVEQLIQAATAVVPS